MVRQGGSRFPIGVTGKNSGKPYLVGDGDDSLTPTEFESVPHPVTRIDNLPAATLNALHEKGGDLTTGLLGRVDQPLHLLQVQPAQFILGMITIAELSCWGVNTAGAFALFELSEDLMTKRAK